MSSGKPSLAPGGGGQSPRGLHRPPSARGDEEPPRLKDEASSSRALFIVDAPATMLKRNPELSRNARSLYGTMRALADGKTGHLKIKGQWLRASVFDRTAEMCRCVRLRAMRELVAYGLVSVERERVERFIGGRRRVVLGRCRYTVHRQAVAPKTIKKPRILQESIPSTVEEIDPQYLSTPPCRAVPSEGVENLKLFSGNAVGCDHQNLHPADDGFSASASKNSNTVTAKTLLLSKGHDSQMVDIALARVADLAASKKKIPRSPAYFVASVERALADPEERAELEAILVERTEKGIEAGAPLDVTEKHRASKIVLLHEVVEEAARIGRPAREVLAHRLACEQRHRETSGDPINAEEVRLEYNNTPRQAANEQRGKRRAPRDAGQISPDCRGSCRVA